MEDVQLTKEDLKDLNEGEDVIVTITVEDGWSHEKWVLDLKISPPKAM